MPAPYKYFGYPLRKDLPAERDTHFSLTWSLSSSQWANDDANWMITLCDLTFLLLGFLLLWYVSDKKESLAKPKTQVTVTEERKTSSMIREMQVPLSSDQWNAT